MRFVLAKGISFCTPRGRTIFLDVPGDRYLCLAADADRSFQRLAAAESLTPEDRQKLDELVSIGLLAHSCDPHVPQPCNAPFPRRSLFDVTCPTDVRMVVRALSRIARAELETRVRPLRSTLERLQQRKLNADFQDGESGERLERIAAALRASLLIVSGVDQCLCRSVAAAHMMIDLSIRPELVIGVQLQPFSAHCWVQHRGMLINDVLDRVRNYTPILVV